MDGGDPGGGSQGLAELIDRHGEALLADFERYYTGLPELMRSGASPRYLLSLIRQLPMESNTTAQMRGGEEFRGWGVDQYLLANLTDAVNAATYAIVASNSKSKPKPPEPVYRPDKATKKKRANSFAMMAARQMAAARKAQGE